MRAALIKDFLHWGSGLLLLAVAGASYAHVPLPGVSVDPKTAALAGLGVLAAGLKSGWRSK